MKTSLVISLLLIVNVDSWITSRRLQTNNLSQKDRFITKQCNVVSKDTTTIATEDSEYKKDIVKTFGWVGAAAIFGVGLSVTKGNTAAIEFFSGYVLEESLSIDNLFVFLILFDYFKISKDYQSRVLSYGLWGAVILRGLFIGIGAVAIQEFHQILLLFAGVLLYSSYGILSGQDEEEEDLENNTIIKIAKNIFKTTSQFDGNKFFTADGLATPLFICLICLELSDVVFAFDSVPAVFGVTTDPFIVYTSNIFAIAGLRALFGVLSQAVSDLEYLEKAVAVVLAFIAVKLGAEAFDITLVTPLQSLAVVLTLLSGGVFLSLRKNSQVKDSIPE